MIENVLRSAVRVFGEEHQTQKAVEEMGEVALKEWLMENRGGYEMRS